MTYCLISLTSFLFSNRKFSDTYWLNVADQGFPFGGIIEHTNFIPSSKFEIVFNPKQTKSIKFPNMFT